MSEWLTHQEAAEILGVGKTTVQRLADEGVLVRRDTSHRGRPSLSQESVQRELERLTQVREQRAERKRQREARRAVPPDMPGEWLREGPAAEVAGMTGPGLANRARRDAIPHVVVNGYRWYRRDHMEVFAQARRPVKPAEPGEYRARGLAAQPATESPQAATGERAASRTPARRPDGSPWTVEQLDAARSRLRGMTGR